MTEEAIPFNKIEASAPTTLADLAECEGITEEEWRARNLPSEKLELRWRYDNKQVPLYERRLRSLRAFNVGPAVQAWVRSRLEWVIDNKLYEMPDGVIVLSIDPEGVVEIQQEAQAPVPSFLTEQLETDDAPGTLWFAKDGVVHCSEEPRQAADTFARDLVTTLGNTFEVGRPEVLDGVEAFVISDEFGIVPCEGKTGAVTDKLVECFDKLWSQKQGA